MELWPLYVIGVANTLMFLKLAYDLARLKVGLQMVDAGIHLLAEVHGQILKKIGCELVVEKVGNYQKVSVVSSSALGSGPKS